MRIKRAAVGDEGALAELAAATFALACPPDTTRADIAAHIRDQLNPTRFREVLRRDDRIVYLAADGPRSAVGYVMLCVGSTAPAALAGTRALELRRLYVRSQAHGTGLAAALLGRAEDWAGDNGYRSMWLGTNKANVRALRFYGKHGFKRVGERDFRVGTSIERDYELAKDLSAEARD